MQVICINTIMGPGNELNAPGTVLDLEEPDAQRLLGLGRVRLAEAEPPEPPSEPEPEPEEPPLVLEDMTLDQLREELTAREVKFPANAGEKKLRELLAAAIEKEG